MDTTFFGRYFGVLVLMDTLSNNVISHYFVRTEKDIYYKLALNRLREKGYIIQSITYDGRRSLMKDLFNTPVQMCQFHMVAIVMRKLSQINACYYNSSFTQTNIVFPQLLIKNNGCFLHFCDDRFYC